MQNYCTYFDKNYLLRGLTPYRSLMNQNDDFTLFVLCLDDEVYLILNELDQPNIITIKLQKLEEYFPELLSARSNRSLIEYYFTLTPALPLYILDRNQDCEMITYLDADLFFYSGPTPIFDELGKNSILIIEYRFPEHLKCKERAGTYNVQFLSFRNDKKAKECLVWWKDQCLTWCYDRFEDGKFADQKYLDDWPGRFKNVVVLQHKGAGLSTWNWMRYEININGPLDRASVDGQDLIFYHFHRLKLITGFLINHGMYYDVMPTRLRRWFYGGYVKQLKETVKWINKSVTTKQYINCSDARGGVSLVRTVLSGIKNRKLMWVW